MSIESTANHIYRVAKFIVPATARSEFLSNANRAREVLTKEQGFVRDLYLEQLSETGESTIVTVAEWESQEAVERASAALATYLKSISFNSQEANRRLSVHSEAGLYQTIYRENVQA